MRFLPRSNARELRAPGGVCGSCAIVGFVLSPSLAFANILRKRDRDFQAAFWFVFFTRESKIKFGCVNWEDTSLSMSSEELYSGKLLTWWLGRCCVQGTEEWVLVCLWER